MFISLAESKSNLDIGQIKQKRDGQDNEDASNVQRVSKIILQKEMSSLMYHYVLGLPINLNKKDNLHASPIVSTLYTS